MNGTAGSRVSVIIPCCNEEEAVALLPARLYPSLEKLEEHYAVELVLVDDGSRDGTWARLEALAAGDHPGRIVLARHETNRGLGAALQTGNARATGDIVVTLDCDGTYPFLIVLPLVHAIEEGADVVTASPYHPHGEVEGVSGVRLLFSRGASLCYRALVDPRIHTWTAMVRGYRAEVLDASISANTGFLHVAETLVEARRRGARVCEVPAILSSRRVGQSKAKVARITRSHLRYMARLLGLRATRRFWIAGRSAAIATA